jgi:hypothetical protein
MAASTAKPQLRTDVKQPNRTTYTITNKTEDRTFDCNAAAVAELCDVVATLLDDLAALGLVDVA